MLLDPPPKDEQGSVTPHDHRGIADEDIVIRRISEEQLVEKNGRRVVSSIAFKGASSNGGMSVDIEKVIVALGHNPVEFVTTPRWIGSVRLVVGELRTLGLIVGYNPLPDNEAHGEVWGITRRPTAKAVQKAAVWFVQIDQVDLIST